MGEENLNRNRQALHPDELRAAGRGDDLPVWAVVSAAGVEADRRCLARVGQRPEDRDLGRARVGDAREAGVVRGTSRSRRGCRSSADVYIHHGWVRAQRHVECVDVVVRDRAVVLGVVGHGGVAGQHSAQPGLPAGVVHLTAIGTGAEGVCPRHEGGLEVRADCDLLAVIQVVGCAAGRTRT